MKVEMIFLKSFLSTEMIEKDDREWYTCQKCTTAKLNTSPDAIYEKFITIKEEAANRDM